MRDRLIEADIGDEAYAVAVRLPRWVAADPHDLDVERPRSHDPAPDASDGLDAGQDGQSGAIRQLLQRGLGRARADDQVIDGKMHAAPSRWDALTRAAAAPLAPHGMRARTLVP